VDTAARACRAPTACRLLLVLAGLACALPAAAATPEPAPLTSAADAPQRAPVSQEQAYEEFKRLFEAGEHAAAVEQARKVVEMAERAEPAAAEELQVAVMNLGLAERTAGDYVAAEASYQRAIALIEASGRLTTPRYARAHAGLALTYHDARRYDLAAPAFDRAIALNRRAEGLFNEDQLPLLERQADALTELGRADEALQAHRYALRLVGRRSGERSLRYASELESFGRWYTRARAYDASRATLKRSAELIAALQGPEALELIGPGLSARQARWPESAAGAAHRSPTRGRASSSARWPSTASATRSRSRAR
jgi:tetratricopeptide (TPR) repeat protein